MCVLQIGIWASDTEYISRIDTIKQVIAFTPDTDSTDPKTESVVVFTGSSRVTRRS